MCLASMVREEVLSGQENILETHLEYAGVLTNYDTAPGIGLLISQG